jgi:glyoxylase-like metal-dependent hydrolase (beta-lactamase superfamily II)
MLFLSNSSPFVNILPIFCKGLKILPTKFGTTPVRIELSFLPNEGAVNVYLFREPEPVLIDTGFNSETAWHVLRMALDDQDLAVSDLARVIITHPHVDHYGFAARIARESQAEIWMADVGVQWLDELAEFDPRSLEMIAHDFLLSQRNQCKTLSLPEAWETSGYYPTEYCIRYSAESTEYTVSLEKFVFREVSPLTSAEQDQ